MQRSGEWPLAKKGRRTAGVVVDTSLGKHGVVLNLGLPQGRAVAQDDDELGLTLAERLEGRLVAEGVLAGLHDEGKARVDALLGLFLKSGSRMSARCLLGGMARLQS